METSIENLTNMRKASNHFDHTWQNPVLNSVKRSSKVYTAYRPILMAALLATVRAVAQDAPREIRVGDRAPLFTLRDQDDREFSLETMVKKGPVAVVFVRSVQWCSYCQLQTVQLSRNLEKVQAVGGQVVVVCYDAPEKVKRFAERREIKVPVLSDFDSKTIAAYAMRAVSGAGDQLGSAQHGTFVIDMSGIVRSKPYLTSFEGDAAVDVLKDALKDANTRHVK